MEVQNFDEQGNKIGGSNPPQNNSNNTNSGNNPKIIHHSRLDSLPVVRLGGNESNNEEKIQTETKNISQEKTSFQTKVKKEKSKYEIDKDTFFLVEFGVMFTDDQIIIIPKENFEEADGLAVNLYEKHWVKFRMWNFLESQIWKQECMEFLQVHRIFNLNTNKFNELKVRRLLLEWSFNDYDNDHKLFHVNKQLTDESMDLFFKRFNPMIIQYVVNKMNEFLGEQ